MTGLDQSQPDQNHMLEALNLTKAGRLTEATALIQRTLGSGSPTLQSKPDSSPEGEGDPVNRLSEVVQPLRLPWAGTRGLQLPRQGSNLPRQTPPPESLGSGVLLDRTYANHAGARQYKVYVPPECPDQGVMVIVMLHGGTQAVLDYAAGTGMNKLADIHRFVVVYPEQDARANPMRYWNWFRPQDQRAGNGEPGLIAGITEQVISDYHADPDKAFIVGFSAGAAMATVMAATYPDLYAAAGVHSGLPYGTAHDVASAFALMRGENLPAQKDAALRIPLIVFHGDHDQIVDVVNASRIRQQRLGVADALTRAEDVTVTPGQVAGGHGYTRTSYGDQAQVLFEQWIVHGAGHAWFGGTAGCSYTDPRGPNASAEMVRFFAAHSSVEHQG
jgi:poly(hydroxyalkanoate) depolymerase family esterase